jgi:hypothetical protein
MLRGHDHADQHGLEGERGQDHAEDPFVPRTVAGCRHRRGQRENNNWGRPLFAAVHVANWYVSDELIIVNIDRLRVIKSLLAHGADVNGRNTDMEPRWSGARHRRRLVGATALLQAAKSGDVEAMKLLPGQWRRPKNQYGPQHHAADGGGRHRLGGESGQGERSGCARSSEAAR